MALTKGFNEPVRNRAATGPGFATALPHDTADTAPITVREALRQIWEAARYPIRGNEDWRIAARLDAEALERAGTAVPGPNDPPEFARWIAALRDPKLPDSERDDILSAIYDVFDPDRA